MNRIAAMIVCALLLSAFGVVRAATATSVVVVRPGSMAGWSIVNHDPTAGTESSEPTTRGSFGALSDGPAGTPLGLGSHRMVLAHQQDSTRLDTAALNGRRIADINELSYSTYITGGGGGAAPTLQIQVDRNGDGAYRLTEDDLLTFEPAYQHGGERGDPVPNQCPGVPGCVGKHLWQRWSGATGGWWSYRQLQYGAPLLTLDHYQLLNPSAVVAGLRVSAGGGGTRWDGFDGSVDRIRIDATDYDLESYYLLADCVTSSDDLSLVQSKVDVAPAGFAVRLRGTCDFSQAAPHGGDASSITAAAVVLRSQGPAANLTIEPDGAAHAAAVVGSGSQTAFFVPPGAVNIAIRGLRFAGFARPIVAVSTDGTMVSNIRVSGGTTMNAGILAVASGAPQTIAYGVAGAQSVTYAGNATMSGLTVEDSRIVYQTVGVPTHERPLIGIDARSTGSSTLHTLRLVRNAVWFATNELRSFDINAIRVSGARQTVIEGNTVGRPEDAGEEPTPVAAGGRAGIVLERVDDATIASNRIRSRVSVTPAVNPGGGIVLSETRRAVVRDNVVSVLVDASAEASDLGAIAVIDDLDERLGRTPSPGLSEYATVTGNIIGETGFGAYRGLALAGSSWSEMTGNTIRYSAGSAVTLGPAVATSVVCDNQLDGIMDNPNEVQGNGAIASSNFPGGELLPGNGGCLPAGIAITESDGATRVSESGGADSYLVSLDRRPRSTVTITITAGSQASVTPTTLTFSADAWATPQPVTVAGTQDTVPEGTHLQSIVHAASSSDATYAGKARTILVQVFDDDPGSVLVEQSAGFTAVAEGGVQDTYTVTLGSRPSANVQVVVAPNTQLFVSPTTIVFTQADWATPRTVTVSAADDTLREGAHFGSITHRVTSPDANFNNVPVAGVLATITDNDRPPPPIIDIPSEGSTVRSTSLVVSGRGEPRGVVELTTPSGVVSATVSSQGRWSTAPIAFTPGSHVLSALLVDPNGFRSVSMTRTFRIDLTPPPAPVIIDPNEGQGYFEATITVRGTAEPSSSVVITEGSFNKSVIVDAAGAWSTRIVFAEGPHTIVATGYDGAGNVGASSPPRSFQINADGIPPAAPQITGPAPGAVVPKERIGEGGVTLPGFSVTGFTEPNAGVQVWEAGTPLQFGTANIDGSFEIGMMLEPRRYELIVRAVDESQNIGPFTAPRTIFVDASVPTISIRRPSGQTQVTIVPPGEEVVTFGAASDDYGVASVQVRYTDRFGRSVIHQAELCCQDGGVWRWEDRTPLPAGEYRAQAISVDLAGNRSRPSNAQILRL